MSNSAFFRPVDRRSFLRGAVGTAGLIAGSSLLSACGAPTAASVQIGQTLDEIVDLAKKEGTVRLIAYPLTWANYQGHFDAFTKKYGIKIDSVSPEAASAQELQAVKQLKGQSAQPDVLDIGFNWPKQAMDQGLIEKYKPSMWDKVPSNLKDPDGWWTAAYYGVLTIGVNSNEVPVPKKLSDLLDPAYKGKVALPGDPRTGSTSLTSVFAGALARGGNLNDVGPGIDFWRDMSKSGNLVSVQSTVSGMSTGQCMVNLDWSFNWVGFEPDLAKSGIKLETVVPADAVMGNYYVQPLAVASPQPNAGRLWIDWLSSDEGAEQYALGGAVPARFDELKSAGKLSAAALAKLPSPGLLAESKFATPEQGTNATKAVTERWGTDVISS